MVFFKLNHRFASRTFVSSNQGLSRTTEDTQNALDLIFTSNQSLVDRVETIPGIGLLPVV